jgi:hypothetical protein
MSNSPTSCNDLSSTSQPPFGLFGVPTIAALHRHAASPSTCHPASDAAYTACHEVVLGGADNGEQGHAGEYDDGTAPV